MSNNFIVTHSIGLGLVVSLLWHSYIQYGYIWELSPPWDNINVYANLQNRAGFRLAPQQLQTIYRLHRFSTVLVLGMTLNCLHRVIFLQHPGTSDL